MIVGRFGNSTGRPYITAHLVIPSLAIRGSVSFLVDTGADGTVLMPTDSVRLGVDHSKLRRMESSVGVGGESVDFVEDAILVVADKRHLHTYDINLRIIRPRKALATAPSLLGRDVLNRWRLLVDFSKNLLKADIVSSDGRFPLKS